MSSGTRAAEDAGTPTHHTQRIPARTWICGTQAFDLSTPLIMGILNVTPDSFSDGGLYDSVDAALDHARRMRDAGAAIIDVGGESTRPGSAPVDSDEELTRVLPVVEALLAEGFVVSVDTRHASVATACVEAGIHIINDVSGFREAAMQEVVAGSDCGLVVMHMLGEPKTMQVEPHYDDVAGEVEAFLLGRAHELEARGVAAESICLDPGIGFGKTAAHNRILLESQERLASLGYPLMVAVSRKSYIGACTGIEETTQRDEASALCAAAACEDGARIVRAHDVARTVSALRDSRRALVALGSNIEPRLEHLDAACKALRRLPHTWLAAVSSVYESEPAYREDQAPFANAVVSLQTTLSPEELLERLQDIEQQEGRVRHESNGPRTLDLDLIDYEGEMRSTSELTVPHPGVLERDFVVRPLLELYPSHILADGAAVTDAQVRVGKVSQTVHKRFE